MQQATNTRQEFSKSYLRSLKTSSKLPLEHLPKENLKLNIHLFYVPLKLVIFLSGDQKYIRSLQLAPRSAAG